MQYAATTETCNTCQTTFHHLDRGEDGRASFVVAQPQSVFSLSR
jgi:hypothetical protein